MASLASQTTAASLYYAVMGSSPSDTEFKSIGQKIENGQLTNEGYVASLLSSSVGQSIYQGLTDEQVVSKVYTLIYGSAPSATVISGYLSSGSLSSSITSVITSLLDYKGFDSTVLAEQSEFDQHIDSILYSTSSSIGTLAVQEQVAASYLAMLGRDRWVDSAGLKYWSADLNSGTSYENMIKKQLLTSEYQKRVGQLNGDDFIAKVYKIIHGAVATSEQIATFAALGTNKSVIAAAIINDLRSSTATDNLTVSQQHSFENIIGTSLDYKTSAVLSTSASGGNATGSINSYVSHQLSNAETAVLTDIQLNANAATTVNLKFADNLENLEINGNNAATVNLSDNGVNTGVDIVVNNGSVILNASSGSDDVLVTSAVNMQNATAKFNLGLGSDSLKWAGNGVSNNANVVSTTVTANGGDGIDTISANFITKNVVMSGNAISRTATVSTNTSQFTNFEKLDLAGYIGKATVSSGSTAENHTFDFGILTGKAVSESSTTGLTNTVVQAATSTIGSQGFVLSGFADQVHVINAAGGDSAQLEVTGDATESSSVDITFLKNATNSFNVSFTAVSDTDVNAGSISLNSSSSTLFGTSLTDISISSAGTGDFENILSLIGTNTQVQNIDITGDHVLNLELGSGFSNVRAIDASGNTAGLSLDSSHGGTGDGIIVQLLNALPLGAITTGLLKPVLNTLGLNGYQLDVTGTSGNDTFSVIGNTTITGGGGENTYELKSSNTMAGVTIQDFDSTKDVIVNVSNGLTVSDNLSGQSVADYGTRTADALDALLGSLIGGLTTGVVGLLGGILGLGSSNSLTSKVGVASVVFSGAGDNADSYVIIDNNDNHTLDVNDTVVYLTGQNHQQLVDTLHYA